MFNIYTGVSYPKKYQAGEIIAQLAIYSDLVTDPNQADFFIFPISYEKLYGYTEHEYNHFGYTSVEIEGLKKNFSVMVEMAVKHNKKIVLFYYYDPIKKIDVKNSIVFRTSILKSSKDNNEFSMPAYGDDLRKRKAVAETDLWLQKTVLPTVGFRGQSAPVKLPAKLAAKRSMNTLLEFTGIKKQFNLHYNFGYLARRDAIVACLKNNNIKTDITFTTIEQSWDPINGKMPFVNNVFANQYNICVSGHGNYSFRLYEIMSAGRIPIFINTDCVLPFEEFIDWKKHVVWMEEKDANKADQYVLDFHSSIHPDDFLQLQKDNRKLWEQYLSKEGFFRNLYQYFPLFNQIS